MVAKKKSSHAHKHTAENASEHKTHKEVKKDFISQLMPKDQNAWISAGIFVLIGLIVGTLLIASLPTAVNEPSNINQGIDLANLKLVVGDYINKNLIVDDSVTANIIDANDLGNGLYELAFKIDQNGTIVGEGFVYSNGQKLILAQGIFDLNEDIQTPVVEEPTETVYTKSDIPNVDLYIMSFCPYGLQAVDIFDAPVKQLGEKINFKLNYVIYSNYASNYGQPWENYCLSEDEEYCSMHGIEELKEDVRELCIQRDQKDKLWAYMDLLVADYQAGKVSYSNIEDMWKTYATNAGVDINAVETCVANDTVELLEEQVIKSYAYGVQGSPTAIINDTTYAGARSASAFQDAICSAFNQVPEECGVAVDDDTTAAAGSC
jgi:hypothetical protein